MPATLRMEDRAPSLTTVHLNEGTLRLAESIAERYGISVGDMIDMLLLELVQRAEHTSLPARQATSARVIDLDSWRQRRQSV